MIMTLKLHSVADIAALQSLAATGDKPVYIANEDNSIRVDARSFIGLFALDFTKPVNVITDSLFVIRQLESNLCKQDIAAAVR